LSADQFLTFNIGPITPVFQASVGPIAAGDAFVILTSVEMGVHGFVVVQAIAVGSSVTGTCGTAAVAFSEAVQEEEQCKKEKTE
jgi:hypothetical protein